MGLLGMVGDVAHLFSLILTATSIICLTQLGNVDSKTFPGDSQTLQQLKSAIEPSSIPPGSCLSSWDFSVDPCDHLFGGDHFTCGFRCDAQLSGESRVTEISLDPAGYSGSLSSSVWNLPYLQTLDIADNRLSGPIPPPLPLVTNLPLRRLTLSHNSFSGEIPPSIGTGFLALEELYLDDNVLTGSIPPELAGLQSLKRLELQGNRLSGEFPDLGRMTSLYYLDASDNGISGRIPAGLPESLVEISMRNNALEGELPEDIGGPTYLQVLDLSNNRLSGPVLAVLFGHPALEQLTLSHNRFNFLQIPGDMGRQSGLVAADLGHNQLVGQLPGFIAWMPRMTALSLESNLFTGMIPAGYAAKVAGVGVGEGVVPFARLVLAGNYLYGPIPSPLTSMKEGSAVVSLADNCLLRCPDLFFFCQGGDQKPSSACRNFNPVIP